MTSVLQEEAMSGNEVGPGELPVKRLRVSAAQAQAIAGDVDANVASVVQMIESAAQAGSKLVVFPEKFLSGYEPDLVKADPNRYAVSRDDPRLHPIVEACQRREVAAVVGAATRDDTSMFISSLLFDRRGSSPATYHKQYLFQSEKAIFRQGEVGCLLDLDGWRLGMAICYDTGFAEHARSNAQAGAHAYLASALFSVGNGFHETRIWFPARALDNTVYALLSNHVGTTGGWNACGRSAVWDPYGRLVEEADGTTPSLVTVDLDPEVLGAIRGRETMLSDFRGPRDRSSERFTIYRLD